MPKNYTLQGEPLLDQILGVPTHGFDIDVQFCVDPVDNGALSSCPAGEGHTWGKVSVEAVETGSMYCHTDVTAVFPWLTHALFQLKVSKRKHFRLMDKLKESIAFLQDNYKNAKVGDPKEVKQAGLDGFVMDGTGEDSDGTAVVFRMAWVALKDGHVGEIWFVAFSDDEDGINAGGAALSSFRAP